MSWTTRPQPFGPFLLERMLGRGGMSEVFIAHRRGDEAGDPVVLKRLRPELAQDQEYLERLRFEATVAARLIHPNLVRLLEFGRVGECHYLVMEHVRGYSLRRLLERVVEDDTPPPPAVGLNIGAGILAGLTAMHGARDDHGESRPILHRDVTPSNVIVNHDGQPVLIDFGIAKDVFGPAITRVGTIVGTARYMAPEHRLGHNTDPRADVFSASMILFELLTARHPWAPMSPRKELLRTVFDPPELTPDIAGRIPADVWPVIERGLMNDPDERHRDAASMLQGLESTQTVRALRALGPMMAESTARWVQTMGVQADEALQSLVIDAGSTKPEVAGSVVWSSKGQVAEIEQLFDAARLSDLPDARRVTIPPLGPRVAQHETGELRLAADLGPSRGFRKLAVALLVVLGLVLGVLLRSVL